MSIEEGDYLGTLPPLTALRTRSPLKPATVWIGAAAGLSSGLALVVTILSHTPLWLAATFFLVPTLIALVAVSVMARRHEQELFFIRLRRGALAGVLGTLAYDISRFVVETLGWSSTKTFQAITIFGAGLTGRDPHDHIAIAAGWAFHACNGVGFALAFILVAAGWKWGWGVLYALVLEASMISLYPGWLGITLSTEFLTVSMLGHLAYGTVVGKYAEASP